MPHCVLVLILLPVVVDGGTAWMTRESMLLEMDVVDSSSAPWWILAQQLKEDLASIILMSEADIQVLSHAADTEEALCILTVSNSSHLLLQALVDAPRPELATALGFQEKKAEDLQKTLLRVLDRREEERQSKELLELYLKAVEKENKQEAEPSLPSQQGMAVLL